MSGRFKIPFTIIELDQNSYHLLTEVHINGLPVNVIIDTGASRTVFDKSLLSDKLQIISTEIPEEIHSAGIMAGSIDSIIANMETFKLRKLVLHDFHVVLIDMEAIKTLYMKVTGKNVHGLLGSDFLLQMNAVINCGKSSLILKTSES